MSAIIKFQKIYKLNGVRRIHINRHLLNKNSISDYYKGANIFVTGGTGFLGQAIVEKILYTFPDINTIYLLVRSKRNLQPKERFKQLTNQSIFSNVKVANPEQLRKIKLVEGDVANDTIITNKNQEDEILNNVNIIIHSAATVKFNETLKRSISINTDGTRKMLNLATKLKNCKHYVQVSTAYSNAYKLHVEEKSYTSHHDPYAMINFVKNFSEENINTLSKQLIKPHINPYSLSKCLSEMVVKDYAKKIPITLVRPSVVIASWKRPYPGWTQNIQGANGIGYFIALGQLRSYPCKRGVSFDLMPVDVVADAIIASPWHSTYHLSAKDDLPIYNLTSYNTHRITFNQYTDYCIKAAFKNPSKNMLWYPSQPTNNGYIKEMFLRMFCEAPISIINDIILKIKGETPRCLFITKKFHTLANSVRFVTTNELSFKSNNYEKLVKDVKNLEEGHKFNIDIGPSSAFEWEKYFEPFFVGLCKFAFKEDINTNVKSKNDIPKYIINAGLALSTAIVLLSSIGYIIY